MVIITANIFSLSPTVKPPETRCMTWR